MNDKKSLKIGVNINFNNVNESNPQFTCVSDNVDFMVCHTDPHNNILEESIKKTQDAMQLLESKNIDCIVNFEFQNFCLNPTAPDGTEWAYNTDTIHRLSIPDKYMEALCKMKNFKGIMYDEFEHVISNRNLSIILSSKGKIKRNAFPLCESDNAVEQGELLKKQIKEYSDSIKGKGADIFIGEHVFPIMFHTFAENGMVPNFKSQKESVSNIQFAIAAGAALQYNTPLWTCVDCWLRNTNPGHSPLEMYYNLLFASIAGVNNAYVESTGVFVKDGKPNAYAELYNKAVKKIKGSSRDYTVQDYKPEIGIIRYDDTYWGQGDPFLWKNMLFGNSEIKPDYRSKEYIRIFSMLTHGETGKTCFTWDAINPWQLRPHRSFVTLNSTAVFDDKVRKSNLESLKLCFLSGIHISEDTINDIATLVKENGLTVITPKRFAPDEILKKSDKSYNETADGKGKWIVTDNIDCSKVKKAIKPFIGNKGEIRLTFDKSREIRLKIDKSGNSFKVIK